MVRATAIDATAPAVFAQVNDFSKWQDWSPWVKLDPNAKTTFEGPSAGQGAMFAWSGNDTVGEGSMLLVESRPNELVKSRTDLKRPFEGTSISEFVLTPQGNQIALTWTISGENNFIARAMCVFMNMDRMMGGEMDKGLVGIKAIAEAGPAKS